MTTYPGSLPESGGLNAQPAGLIQQALVAARVVQAIRQFHTRQLNELSDGVLGVWEWVTELRTERDGG